MVTLPEFYLTLPEKIRQEKSANKAGGDFALGKSKIAFEMNLDPKTKKTTIDISMRKLKFFVRPQVFAEISEFFIHCLEKLDLKKDKEAKAALSKSASANNQVVVKPVKPKKKSQIVPVTEINFALLDTIIVLERREF